MPQITPALTELQKPQDLGRQQLYIQVRGQVRGLFLGFAGGTEHTRRTDHREGATETRIDMSESDAIDSQSNPQDDVVASCLEGGQNDDSEPHDR